MDDENEIYFEENNKTKNNKEEKDKKKKNKLGNNNLDIIENQLKLEHQKEEIKKNQAYNELIELKKEENLINVNIQYFENLLIKLKYNENNYQPQNISNLDNNIPGNIN